MKSIITLATVMCLMFSCKAINIQPDILAKTTEDTDYPQVETLITELMEKANFPGLSIAISKDEKIIYAKGFGYADVANKVQMTTETRIRTGSVAKVITATAIGRLVTEGKLDLDAPIKNYIPYIENRYANLTTRQLAGHTAGMIHQKDGNSYKKKQYNEVKEMVEVVKNEPLLFSPDTEYKYSTHAFNLLAAVIEGASGHRYTDFMKISVFDPLKMTQTSPENLQQLTANDAKCYFFQKGKRKLDKKPVNGSYKMAGAAFRSTPTDLVNMMNGYINGFISSTVVKEMFTSHQLKNGTKTNVGIAWRPSYDPFGNAPIDHAGSWTGARTVVVYYPKQQLSVSIMVNAQVPFFIEETAHILAQLFMEKEEITPVIDNVDLPIKVTTHFNGADKNHTGHIKINGEKGELIVATDGFLKANQLYYLGFGNHYTLVTSLGMFYVNLEERSNLAGKLYLYENRNEQNPLEGKAAVSFRAN